MKQIIKTISLLENSSSNWIIRDGIESGDYGGYDIPYWEIEGTIEGQNRVFRSWDEGDILWLQKVLGNYELINQ
jgi:hypothetical protein